ncbi:hypothetical protein ACLMAJ_31915 [Nocardia sp. KC 131]|uniref:hypothetical protein n=1 Tax=Nocardia arseniciresistens TaxID=3392119 RepID=UPI00398E6DCB
MYSTSTPATANHPRRRGTTPAIARDVLAQLAAEVGQPIPVPTYTVSTPSVISRWFGHCNNVINEAIVPDLASLLQRYQQGGNDDHVTGFVRRLEEVVVRVQP